MAEKRLRSALGISVLAVLAVSCAEGTPQEDRRGTEKSSASRLDGFQVVAADEDAVPTFITGALGAVQTEAAAVHSLQAAQLLPVLEAVAPRFRLAPSHLYLKKAYVGFDGDAHFRYGVRVNGLEVLGAEVRLHARNGAVFAANTNARGDLVAPDRAEVAPEVAVAAAREDRASPEGATTRGEPRLVYWREGNQLLLAYEVRVQGEREDGTPVDDSVLVNARTGDVLQRIPRVHSGLSRRVHDGQNLSTLPGVVARTHDPVMDPVVNAAFDNLGSVYHCYNDLFARDSYDNGGALLAGTVHHRSNYVNAYWNGTLLVMGDGDGVTAGPFAYALDLMAHELTHAVTDHESGLIYSGESGGLSESMSDIFGAVCEWYSRGGVVDANTWRVAEDIWTPAIPGDGLRYLDNPTLDGDSLDNYDDYHSGVDVHYSSGISNLAFYLLSQGGLHPRFPAPVPVPGIGMEKAARIFYKMNVDLMLPTTTFEQALTAAEQASIQLGYDAATTGSVTAAWNAVGVDFIHPHPPPPWDLEKDVPITNLSGTRGSKRYFEVQVPEAATDLTITLAGGTGDADLYVRYGLTPQPNAYDCRPFRTGNNEQCFFATPQEGTWRVMLDGYLAFSGATLTATWKGGYARLEPGSELTGLSGDAGSSRVFTLQIPEREDGGDRNIHVRLRGSGNADLYVRRGAAPTHSDYDCRGLNEHSTENCNLNDFAPGKYYVQVFGAKGGYEDGSLLVTYD